MFYDPRSTLSHNCMLNMVVSNRGGGKTYGTLNYACEKFLANGDQFVWVRRTQKETDLIHKSMFAALENDGKIVPGSFRAGKTIITHTDGENEQPCGGIVPLSATSQFKSIAWPKVKYIIFDEFIEEKGRYLKNEVNSLLSLIETIARMRDIKIIMLANSITKFNPYFTYFNLDFNPDQEFLKDRKRSILIHHWQSAEYTERKKKTTFAKMLEGTEYGAFMFENANILDTDDFIRKIKVKNKQPITSFLYEGQGFCCWFVETKDSELLYITKGENKNAANAINFDSGLKENYVWLSRSSSFVKNFKKAAARGVMYFENGSVKLAMSNLLSDIR